MFLLNYFILLICVLLNVAFITLFERKILGYSQNRVGPSKVSFVGILQPMGDAVKLFLKSETKPSSVTHFVFYLAPFLSLFLMLCIWGGAVFTFSFVFFNYSVIYILSFLSLGVYPVLLAGWFSNSSYSFIGAIRVIAQTISYEICLSFYFMLFCAYNSTLCFESFSESSNFSLFLMLPMILPCWALLLLAETNRTPFDFAEGESELVSGFNTEYSSNGFALLFMAEYGMIYFMSYMTSLVFFGGDTLKLSVLSLFFIFFWMWCRATLPRYRYDLMMLTVWKSLLPFVLGVLMFLLLIV